MSSLSAPFIARPVATLLLTIGVLLLGILSYSLLPIAALPSVERPAIGVWAVLPGASPETVAASLAQPLERQLGTIPGIVEMSSFADTGYAEIYMQFELGVDVDAAAGAVQAAISAAGPNLPRDLPQPPRYWKSNPASFPVISIALTSDTLDASEVYSFADTVVAQKLAQIDGVARVYVSGAERGAVRIRVNPGAVANMALSLENVRAAVAQASQNLPKGALAIDGHSYALAANDQLFKAADYADLIVGMRAGTPIRLADIADVTDSVINDRLAGWFGLERAVVIWVMKQPDANVVETVDKVKALLPELRHWIPPAMRVHTVYDRTLLIRASVADVQMTILLAICLVILVIALFLKRVAATVIPGFTIPVAIAAALGGMYVLGYTLDNLSLMALTIAVGFVVDDAIIVVENTIRHVEAGNAPHAAALAGARQIGFTIVSITAALIAALIPVLFMPDVVGRYFREFGMTLVVAILASALVSLTLTPMLCSRLLRDRGVRHERRAGRLARFYRASLDWSLRHSILTLGATLLVMGGSVGLYFYLPKGFMPTQDTGILRVRTITIANVSFAAMEELQREAAKAMLADPAVAGLASWIGTGNGQVLSSGFMWVSLKPPEERRMPIGEVVERLRKKLSKINNLRVIMTPAQDLNLGVDTSGSRFSYSLVGDSNEEVLRWAEALRRRLAAMPELTDVVADWETSGLEAGLRLDRVHAASFGVTPLAIDNALYDAFGQREIRTIYLPTNYQRVVLELDRRYQTDPSVFERLYVPGRDGAAVPLAVLTRPARSHAAMWVRHSDQFPAMGITFDVKPGVAIGSALAAIRAAEAEERIPPEIRASFHGEAGEASKSGTKQLLLFLGAIFAVYVVLGVLYESYAHPFTILSTLPSAAFGALLALAATGTEFTLIAVIACLLLIGMVMKNAILMVDFALELQRKAGLAPRDAIRQAALLRARPILMTTLAAVMTALPLAIGTGPGFELRQPLGIAVAGGLVVSQLLTLYTTPAVFLAVDGLRRRVTRRRSLAYSQ